MLPPLIRRQPSSSERERGVTLALVALAIFSIIAMAGLSIDIGTLYQASAEAQRAADAAALAGARVLSLSGITGDPTNLSAQWSNACTAATQTAQTVGSQDQVGGAPPSSVTVTFTSSDGSTCATGSGAFGVNPMVTVKVSQSSLPTYFSRIWGRSGSSVSASATAEVFNPSNSGAFSSSKSVVPVQARCVKPLVVPNLDPLNPSPTKGAYCTPATTPCKAFINLPDGSIVNGGIQVSGGGTGVIGENFSLTADCAVSGTCIPLPNASPQPNVGATAPPNLQYLPGQVVGTPVAVPGCGSTNPYQQAVAGCDQSTPYQCGVQSSTELNPNEVDLTENPIGSTGDTATAVQCLINESAEGSTGNGQDQLLQTSVPYQIEAGSANPLGVSGSVITSSNSIVSVPIYDQTQVLVPNGSNQAPVTIVGFLQVFVRYVDPSGNLNVTVLNVAGCGNAVSNTAQAIYGTSPVPIRLITPP